MQDQEPEQQRGSRPETARDAAKEFLRPYTLDGWTAQEISRKQPRTDRADEYAAQVGGGKTTDHRNQERTISREQIAVTRVGAAPCWAIFELAQLMAEIRDEQRGYEAQPLPFFEEPAPDQEQDARTLAAIFTQEPPAPAPTRKAPALYRSYMGGECRNPACRAELGHIETDGGRDRLYCNDACRVAAHRARKREEKRAATLQYHGELREYWYEHRITGQLLAMLQNILVEHGKEAARAATDAVLFAQRDQARNYGYRLEPPAPPRP